MRVVLIAVLVTLISFGHVTQDNPTKPDGRMWANFGTAGQQSNFIKAAYVQGAIEGLRAGAARGYGRGRLDAASDAVNYVKQCGHPCANIAGLAEPGTGWAEGMDKLESEVSPEHASVLDIAHQMDKFYGDYKNAPVCMIVAVQESIESLKGKASPEQGLELMREQGCS